MDHETSVADIDDIESFILQRLFSTDGKRTKKRTTPNVFHFAYCNARSTRSINEDLRQVENSRRSTRLARNVASTTWTGTLKNLKGKKRKNPREVSWNSISFFQISSAELQCNCVFFLLGLFLVPNVEHCLQNFYFRSLNKEMEVSPPTKHRETHPCVPWET